MPVRNRRWYEPKVLEQLGIAQVRTHEGRIVAVGRVTLDSASHGAIDFAACASVVPPPGDYVLHFPRSVALATLQPGRAHATRLLLTLQDAVEVAEG